MFWKLMGTGLAAFVGYKMSRRSRPKNAAYSENQPHNYYTDVRDAGPGAMRDGCARDWTAIDEGLDESFPASDPPGGY